MKGRNKSKLFLLQLSLHTKQNQQHYKSTSPKNSSFLSRNSYFLIHKTFSKSFWQNRSSPKSLLHINHKNTKCPTKTHNNIPNCRIEIHPRIRIYFIIKPQRTMRSVNIINMRQQSHNCRPDIKRRSKNHVTCITKQIEHNLWYQECVKNYTEVRLEFSPKSHAFWCVKL